MRVLLVGDDQGRTGYREDLEAQIGRIGAEGIIHLTGPCRDMAAAYMLAGVVVSASTDPEAFGRVAAEAQRVDLLLDRLQVLWWAGGRVRVGGWLYAWSGFE